MERNSSGALRAPGAFEGRITPGGASGAAATFLSMRVCRRSVASHARLLACSGAVAFGRSTSGGAATRRTGAAGATLRVRRTHCDVAESGFIGGRRRLGRALYPPTDARFE